MPHPAPPPPIHAHAHTPPSPTQNYYDLDDAEDLALLKKININRSLPSQGVRGDCTLFFTKDKSARAADAGAAAIAGLSTTAAAAAGGEQPSLVRTLPVPERVRADSLPRSLHAGVGGGAVAASLVVTPRERSLFKEGLTVAHRSHPATPRQKLEQQQQLLQQARAVGAPAAMAADSLRSASTSAATTAGGEGSSSAGEPPSQHATPGGVSLPSSSAALTPRVRAPQILAAAAASGRRRPSDLAVEVRLSLLFFASQRIRYTRRNHHTRTHPQEPDELMLEILPARALHAPATPDAEEEACLSSAAAAAAAAPPSTANCETQTAEARRPSTQDTATSPFFPAATKVDAVVQYDAHILHPHASTASRAPDKEAACQLCVVL